MNADSEGSFFSLRGMCKRFADREVIRDVSLEIPAGRTTVILGGSGAGKSVLLKHLNGLLRPDLGSIRVEGREISHLSEKELFPVRQRIGILFQDGALFDSMTVGENVGFSLRETGLRDEQGILDAARGALEEVGLAGEEDKLPGLLSGGMRKRVALARAMITRPACLLCDEPTAGLDPILSETIAGLIRRTTREGGLTSVIVTHDLAVMRLMADRVVFLRRGKVRFSGTVEELPGSNDPELLEFLGSSAGGG